MEKDSGEKLVFDPNEENLNFGYRESVLLRCRFNLFKFLRKELKACNFRFWKDKVDMFRAELCTHDALEKAGLPRIWDAEKHDKTIVRIVTMFGID